MNLIVELDDLKFHVISSLLLLLLLNFIFVLVFKDEPPYLFYALHYFLCECKVKLTTFSVLFAYQSLLEHRRLYVCLAAVPQCLC